MALRPDQGGRRHVVSTIDMRDVAIPPIGLAGALRMPQDAHALVVFAHGSGSSRLSPRNMQVAEALNRHGLATLLFDLLTVQEEGDRANVFNIHLLAMRLLDAVEWLSREPTAARLPLGLFGASTGAAAALVAAARLGERVGAVVSRGGRPDLAGDVLEQIRIPTLLIVGGIDFGVIDLNQRALARLQGPKALEIVPGASHLFPEPGALDAVIDHTARWFNRYLVSVAVEPVQATRR
jgi:pimeloyl-ACP methyl ester carboxylesterase